MFRGTFVTQFKTTEVPEPTEGLFDDVAGSPQAAAVFAFRVAVGSQQRSDAPLHDLPLDCRAAVGRVSLKDFRLAAWPSPPACDGGRSPIIAVGLHSIYGIEEGNTSMTIASKHNYLAICRPLPKTSQDFAALLMRVLIVAIAVAAATASLPGHNASAENWTAQPDPGEAAVSPTFPAIHETFPLKGRPFMVAAGRTSCVVAFADLGLVGEVGSWRVMNIDKAKWRELLRFPSLAFGITRNEVPVLSPDGRYIAFAGAGVNVVRLDADHQTLVIKAAKSPVDFVSPTQLAVNVVRGTKPAVVVWDLAKNEADHEFQIPTSYGLNGFVAAVSPGGKQLAVADQAHVTILDVADGKVLGEVSIVNAKSASNSAQAAAFSEDGTRLAVVFERPVYQERLIELTMADGKIAADVELALRESVRLPAGRTLQFFPGSHKVRYQQFVIDPEAGEAERVWSPPAASSVREPVGYFVAGANSLGMLGPADYTLHGTQADLVTATVGK